MIVARLFPGDRRVWWWSLVILVPALVLLAYEVLTPRDYFTATDSIGARAAVTGIDRGQTLCTSGVPLAAGTGAIQFYISSPPNTSVAVTARSGGRVVGEGTIDAVAAPPTKTSVPLRHPLPAGLGLGTVCLKVTRTGPVVFAGFGGRFNGLVTRVDGKVRPVAVAIWLAPPDGQKRSLWDNWSVAMRRMALFRPGFAGDVLYWLLFIVGVPLLGYAGIRLLAVAQIRSTQRLALGLVAVSFCGGAIWAISTSAFDAPDEPEHFAYVEHLAQTGHAPQSVPTATAVDPSDEALALDASHHFAVAMYDDTRIPWLAAQQRNYIHALRTERPSNDDGGGEAAATAPHSPLYYALLIPGYAIGSSESTFGELFWMRLSSALLASLVVLGAFLTIRELAPRRPELAVAGGLLVAFQPMFSFMSGAVNNDNGVNALAALTVYLAVRLLRRGPSYRLAAALGVTVGLLPLMKATGYALFPAVAVAVLAMLWRHRNRRGLTAAAISLTGFLVITGIWALLATHFGRSVIPVPGGTSGTVSSATSGGGAGGGLLAHFVYAVEVFIPHLPGFAQHWASGIWPFNFIYVQRGFASFGWVADFFPLWVYSVILVTMCLTGVSGLAMAFVRRHDLKRVMPEAAVLMLVIVGVLLVVEFAYYSATPRNPGVDPEQGRYAFPAAVPLAGLAVAGLLAIRRRARTVPILAMLVSAMIVLATASHLLYIVASYT